MNAPQPTAHLLTPDPGTDTDPQETQEWRDAFESLLGSEGPERARFVLDELSRLARAHNTGGHPELCTPYVNSISVDRQPPFPGDLAINPYGTGPGVAINKWSARYCGLRDPRPTC